MSDVERITLTEQPTLAVSATCPFSSLGDTIGRSLNAVGDHLKATGVEPTGPPYVRYHTFSPEHIDLESGFPVASPQPGAGEVTPSSLPGGAAVHMLHAGHYDQLSSAHERVQEHIAANGFTMGPGPWEVYLNDPESTAPEDLRTDVIYPLA